MLGVLVGIALPPLVFGVFALLAMWLGAETRPWFDERPVLDDRPNWGPIRRRLPRDREEDAFEADEPARRATRARGRAGRARSVAPGGRRRGRRRSPSGV